MSTRDHGRSALDQASMLREADALLSDPHAFDAPQGLSDAPGMRVLNIVCWIALVVIFVGTNILLWRIK